MIYALKKFHHYILGNNFTFFVDHLVNKPTIIGRIARWLLLLQEFGFKVIYKPRKVHFVPNQLSCAKNDKPTIGVEDQLLMLFFSY
jgi:hypothetical protein